MKAIVGKRDLLEVGSGGGDTAGAARAAEASRLAVVAAYQPLSLVMPDWLPPSRKTL